MRNDNLKLVKKTCLIMVLFLINLYSFAQASDNLLVPYTEEFVFEEGVYHSFQDFKLNRPSIPTKTIKKGNKVFYRLNDSLVPLLPDQVWGYTADGNVYIASEGVFWKCINIGTLTQFSEVSINNFTSVDMFGNPRQVQTKSLNQSFLDMYTGLIYAMNYKNLKPYIESEPTLAKYIKNNRKAKHQELILVLRAYNELNPLYIPVYE